jgi:hypothetical protein
MADAVTRSHLADGRVVGWYGAPGTVIDAEICDVAPAHLVARFGAEDFVGRWTRAECAAKLADVPMQVWITRHGLTAAGIAVETVEVDDLVVSVARCEITHQPVSYP